MDVIFFANINKFSISKWKATTTLVFLMRSRPVLAGDVAFSRLPRSAASLTFFYCQSVGRGFFFIRIVFCPQPLADNVARFLRATPVTARVNALFRSLAVQQIQRERLKGSHGANNAREKATLDKISGAAEFSIVCMKYRDRFRRRPHK